MKNDRLNIFSFFYIGTVICCKKYKPLIFVYLGLLFCFVINQIFIVLILLTALGMGLFEYFKGYHQRKERNYYFQLFEDIKLESLDGDLPCYLYEKELSGFATIIVFRTIVPLNEWLNKKDVIQMYLNEKILDIRQSQENYQEIGIIIQDNDLSDRIDWKDSYIIDTKNVLNIGIGYYGLSCMDLDKHPHAFIAGETGSGKSNILKCMIHQALIKNYDVILIDFKRGVSFSEFSDYVEIHYEYKSVLQALKDMVYETKHRLDLFRESKVDNINDYNRLSNEPMNRKIIFIDELAELLKTRDKSLSNLLYDSLETLTRLSRAVGIHLIMGIQRPDATIVSGQIKNNVPFRICGRFVDKEPSRIMLGSDTASTLRNIKGRFIIKDDNLEEVQSFYFTGGSSYGYHLPKRLEPDSLPSNTQATDEETTRADTVVEQTVAVAPAFEFDFSEFKN